jgi:hypothetical protein
VTDETTAPGGRGCVVLGNVFLIALGVGLLVVHAVFISDMGDPAAPGSWTRLGAAILAVPSALVGATLLIAGLSRRSVPRVLRRIELAVVTLLVVATLVEWI